ncbi:MAG: hypothetical protein NZ750_04485 [Anaerolineae bacterium]|nr:hypothetical protein [Anaerolineae bacterium]MDW8171230.1 hypothetical protein [Anaerolineae bacterium]
MRDLRPLTLSLVLALCATLPVLAQEEAAPAPTGVTVLLLLVGIGAVALIGFVVNARESKNQDGS